MKERDDGSCVCAWGWWWGGADLLGNISTNRKKFYSDNVQNVPLKECFQQPRKILSHFYGSR